MSENITTKSRTWLYPRFVQMLIDHAYSDIERDVNNDLLVLSHMSNDSLKQLARYHLNHPEPKKIAEFFGFIKDANYVDPDPVNHQNWRNEEEMKEAAYADELKALEEFKSTRNDWFVKEPRKRSKKATPKAQKGEDHLEKLEERRAAKEQKQMKIDSVTEAEKVIEVEKIIEVDKIVEVIKPCSKCLESCIDCAAKDEKLAELEKMKDQLLFNLNYVKESYDVLNRTKVAKTLLIDEPDVEEPVPEAEVEVEHDVEAEAETEAEANIEVDVRLSPNSQSLLKKLKAFDAQKDKAAVDAQKGKAADDIEGDDVNKSTTSSSSSSEDEIDEVEREKRIQEEIAKERQLRKRKRQEKDDDAYIPSPEHVSESQSTPSGGRKNGARKRIVSPKIKKVTQKIKKPTKIVLKKKPSQESSKPPSPPPEPIPHQSPIHSTPNTDTVTTKPPPVPYSGCLLRQKTDEKFTKFVSLLK
ncbi:uncharacterized protein DDB_G0284459-like [Helianthus annuus]|uniref:uncharacterized protein DDB_G0284459-like n=1 Tax=Helianthus annuus TaxID=4232 RepID=UPI0016531DA3|nr:uncharacterized protein DDB_G0284459-like [Helianthus annuus]